MSAPANPEGQAFNGAAAVRAVEQLLDLSASHRKHSSSFAVQAATLAEQETPGGGRGTNYAAVTARGAAVTARGAAEAAQSAAESAMNCNRAARAALAAYAAQGSFLGQPPEVVAAYERLRTRSASEFDVRAAADSAARAALSANDAESVARLQRSGQTELAELAGRAELAGLADLSWSTELAACAMCAVAIGALALAVGVLARI